MNESDLVNLHALLTHVEWTYKLWSHYRLYDALNPVGSPAGIKLLDHVRDANLGAGVLRRRFLEPMRAASEEARRVVDRAMARLDQGVLA